MLKRDFPRVPLATNRTLFDTLVTAGRELIALHTMDQTLPQITRFDVADSNAVVKVSWTPGTGGMGKIHIIADQHFDEVPEEVWETHIGGYRVAEKWLKARKSRLLNYDDITHYQSVVAALARTLSLQTSIDQAIAESGRWPLLGAVLNGTITNRIRPKRRPLFRYFIFPSHDLVFSGWATTVLHPDRKCPCHPRSTRCTTQTARFASTTVLSMNG